MPSREPAPELPKDLLPLARVIAENVRALLNAGGPDGQGPTNLFALATRIDDLRKADPAIPDVGRSSIKRARDGDGAVRISTIAGIAKAYGVPAYLLLWPSLVPHKLPDLGLTEAERRELGELRSFAQIIKGILESGQARAGALLGVEAYRDGHEQRQRTSNTAGKAKRIHRTTGRKKQVTARK